MNSIVVQLCPFIVLVYSFASRCKHLTEQEFWDSEPKKILEVADVQMQEFMERESWDHARCAHTESFCDVLLWRCHGAVWLVAVTDDFGRNTSSSPHAYINVVFLQFFSKAKSNIVSSNLWGCIRCTVRSRGDSSQCWSIAYERSYSFSSRFFVSFFEALDDLLGEENDTVHVCSDDVVDDLIALFDVRTSRCDANIIDENANVQVL